MADEIPLDDGAVEVEIPAAIVETTPEPDVAPDQGIAELREQLVAANKNLEVERRAKEMAERRAAASDQQTVQFRTQAEQANYDSVLRALDQHQAQADMIEARYVAAMNAGDWATAGKAQREMGTMMARIAQLEDGKHAMEQRKPTAPAVAQPADPVEARLAAFTPQTRAWLEAHREVLTDPQQGQLAAAADIKAQRAGHRPDTPDYFAFVERELGYAAGAPATTRQPSPAAPPSRDNGTRVATPSGTGLTAEQMALAQELGVFPNGKSVRLSAKARANAETCGMTDADYALATIKQIQDGKISRSVH